MIKNKLSYMIVDNKKYYVDEIFNKFGKIELFINCPYGYKNYTSIIKWEVDKAKRKQGIGSKLVKEVIRKYEKIYAWCLNKNSTRILYHLGFYPKYNKNASLKETLKLFEINDDLEMIYD